ncbi:hypothetical protein SCMU_03670 [Sinomonas cyclohexanicum]|uniref:EcsC protein family protein n=1 Tax=Sinomonas cyclohexanicum TaxID=322009 RepID=A0ABM7PQQ3_SINCY|nr:hypothetical protein [Corynebacterium cyclohexanicum]BCT74525.1 hypothetical protein SCMU_03670 [Corynebacterium cyclohexanicum]
MAKKNIALRIAQDTAHQAMFDSQGRATPRLHRMLLRAVDVQRPLVLANLRRVRRVHPDDTPAQLARRLERDYLTAVGGTGAAVGGTAAVPGVGTMTSLGLSAAATVGFLEATALYAAMIAELHGVRLEDPERARTTIMALMLGEEGTAMLSALSGQALGKGAHPARAWGAALNRSVPSSAVKTIQGTVQKRFLAWLLKKQGGALVGRALPFGIGAVVGGAGNLVMGRAVIRATREAFGPPPVALPGDLRAASGIVEKRRGLLALVTTSRARSVPARPGAPAAVRAVRAVRAAETPEQAVEREIEERRARLHERGPEG